MCIHRSRLSSCHSIPKLHERNGQKKYKILNRISHLNKMASHTKKWCCTRNKFAVIHLWTKQDKLFVYLGSNSLSQVSITGSGRPPPPGKGNDNALQYSCLGNSVDRGAWWATVHGVAKNWTQLINWVHTHTHTVNTLPSFKISLPVSPCNAFLFI